MVLALGLVLRLDRNAYQLLGSLSIYDAKYMIILVVVVMGLLVAQRVDEY